MDEGSITASGQPKTRKSQAGSSRRASGQPRQRRKAATVSGFSPVGPPAREQRIAELAYFKAERRGFASGGELQDWLEAEREVDGAA